LRMRKRKGNSRALPARVRKYNERRKKLRREVGPGRMRIEKLLGYPKLVKHTLEFVANTKGEL